jgi:predicted transcriptional regulator of viral defense system
MVAERGILRPKDLAQAGISSRYLSLLLNEGALERPARGLYMLPNADHSENIALAQAARTVPRGVVCLLSALSFHGLTTQAPFQVWIAIDPAARLPREGQIPLHIVRFSGEALSAGVDTHEIDGVRVRIYCAAKTVADCFKYRNKVGLDVAMEALRDCWRQRACTMDELVHYADICRVGRVMRPYLETLA